MIAVVEIKKDRRALAHLLKGVGAEIGVERGIYSKMICTRNPGVKLYCVDPWKVYDGYRNHVTQDKLDWLYGETVKRLSQYNCEIIRKFSMDAVKDFKDESLDFVYIDANHDYQSVSEDIIEWSKKVKKDGIIAGHDYNEVADAINVDKLYVYMGDKSPSWMFYK